MRSWIGYTYTATKPANTPDQPEETDHAKEAHHD